MNGMDGIDVIGGVDDEKRSRRGPISLEADQRRGHTVSSRLNDDELATLDRLRRSVNMQRGEYLRAASLHLLPPTLPTVNVEAWALLARASSNLNQISHRLNLYEGGAGLLPHISELREILGEFRCELIGAKSTLGDDDESED